MSQEKITVITRAIAEVEKHLKYKLNANVTDNDLTFYSKNKKKIVLNISQDENLEIWIKVILKLLQLSERGII